MNKRRLILDRYKEKPPRPEPEIAEAELPPILQSVAKPDDPVFNNHLTFNVSHSPVMTNDEVRQQIITAFQERPMWDGMEERRSRVRARITQMGQEPQPSGGIVPPPPPAPPAREVKEDQRPDFYDGNGVSFPLPGWFGRLRRKLFHNPNKLATLDEVSISVRAREAVAINQSVPRETPDLIVPAALQGYVHFRGRHQIAFQLNVEELTASGHFLTIMRLMPLPPEGWQVVQTFTENLMVQFTYWRYEPGSSIRED